MKYLYLIVVILSLHGCAHTSIGNGTYNKEGVEVSSFRHCMANCVTNAEDGKHCAKLSKEMEEVCSTYNRSEKSIRENNTR